MGNMHMFITNRVGTPTSQGSTRKVAQTEKTFFSKWLKDDSSFHPSFQEEKLIISRRYQSFSPRLGFPLFQHQSFSSCSLHSDQPSMIFLRQGNPGPDEFGGGRGAELHRIVTYQSKEKAANREMTKRETRAQRGKNKTFGAQITNHGDRVQNSCYKIREIWIKLQKITKKILLGDFEISPGTCEISRRSSPGESRKAYSYHFSGSFQRFKATKMRWSDIRVPTPKSKIQVLQSTPIGPERSRTKSPESGGTCPVSILVGAQFRYKCGAVLWQIFLPHQGHKKFWRTSVPKESMRKTRRIEQPRTGRK